MENEITPAKTSTRTSRSLNLGQEDQPLWSWNIGSDLVRSILLETTFRLISGESVHGSAEAFKGFIGGHL
jgi:hypothetical protein